MEGNLLTKTAALAMEVTLSYIKPGDFVIDATCGNGHDTLRLAEAVSPGGRVLAVDIQQKAVSTAACRLRENQVRNTSFVCDSFLNLQSCVQSFGAGEKPSAVVFNLGYLPGGDKALTTKAEDTAKGAAGALELIKAGGIVTLVMYPGHSEGAEEMEQLLQWAQMLPADRYHTAYVSFPNQKNNPPQILWITKKK